MRALVLLTVLLAFASGCGQKGPLYLRDKPPPGVKPPREERYQPVPYPDDGRRDESADGQQ